MTLSLVNYDRNDREIRGGTKDPGVYLFSSKDPSTIVRRHRYTLESLLLRHAPESCLEICVKGWQVTRASCHCFVLMGFMLREAYHVVYIINSPMFPDMK